MSDKKYSYQICQDEAVIEDFSKLHRDIVNKVIDFCIKHNIEADEFYVSCDGLSTSIPHEKWQPGTDSSLSLYGDSKEKDKPILLSA